MSSMKKLERNRRVAVASGRVVKREVFRRGHEICRFVNFQSLWPSLLHPELKFLTPREIERLRSQSTDSQRGSELLLMLYSKGEVTQRRFVACLRSEEEHRGHILLAKSILQRLPAHEKVEIRRLVDLARSDTPVSSTRSSPAPSDDYDMQIAYDTSLVAPDRPMPPINLVGDLEDEGFIKINRKLWQFFSTGDYSNLETLVQRISTSDGFPSDWKIVAKWFEALIVMHRDNNYNRCITDILLPALKLCDSENSENRIILEGRIYQRLAQIYLVMNHKDLAQIHLNKAKEQLQHVGRGYDKANMFCREAKILSATSSTSEQRAHVEMLFCYALECVPEDAPYALASRPSLILSKAAFHLHTSFGSPPKQSLHGEKRPYIIPPRVSPEDIKKARDTLSRLDDKDIHLAMRRCERQLISAELLRLDGKFDDALVAYQSAKQQGEEANLQNIITIAKSRIQYIECKKIRDREVDSILRDLP